MKSYNRIIKYVLILLVVHVKAQELPQSWNGYSNFVSYHCFIIPSTTMPVLNNTLIDTSFFIGVFFNDNGMLKCGGTQKYKPNNNISVYAYSDDSFTQEKNGFNYGDSVYWKLYSIMEEKEYDISFVKYYSENLFDTSGLYCTNNISVVECLNTGNFVVNAILSPYEVCNYNNLVFISCIHANISKDYTYSWTSIPEGIISNNKSFEAKIYNSSTLKITLVNKDNNCDTAIGYAKIIYHHMPEIIMPTDTFVCISEAVLLSPLINYYDNVKWSTFGDGYFENHLSRCTKYYPGKFDIEQSCTTLKLEAFSEYPCYYLTQKTLLTFFGDAKKIFAGKDTIIAEGEQIFLKGFISCYDESYYPFWKPDSLLLYSQGLEAMSVNLFEKTSFIFNIANDNNEVVASDTINISIIPLSICIEGKNKIKIIPNPVKNKISIYPIINNVEITISNIYGKTLIKAKNSSDIDISNLPPGVYIIQISTREGFTSIKRFIKNK